MGNSLNPIKLIALGVEYTRNHTVESRKEKNNNNKKEEEKKRKEKKWKKTAHSLERMGLYGLVWAKTLS